MMNIQVDYFIDDHKFRDFGVFVRSSSGLFDRPKFKKPLSHSWAEEHGESVDLGLMVYETRRLDLDCFFVADDVVAFSETLPVFLDLFNKNRLLQFRVEAGESNPLLYMVYMSDSVTVSKQFRDGKMVGTFKLTLLEPEPVKRVYKLVTTVSGYVGDLEISGAEGHYFNVYIADKKFRSMNGFDATENLPHLPAGTHYLVITGNITANLDSILTVQETVTVTLLWNKL
jgi:hypothetical protein